MATLRNYDAVIHDGGFINEIKQVTEKAVDLKYPWWIDNTPTSKELMAFAEHVRDELEKIMVGHKVKFIPYRTNWCSGNGLSSYDSTADEMQISLHLITEYSVFVDNMPFDLGRIGYLDHSTGKTQSKLSYGVYSRRIKNSKYNSSRDQYHMLMSYDVSKAITNALKFLIPFTPKELAKAYYQPMVTQIIKHKDEAIGDLQLLINPIMSGTSMLIDELLHLIKQNVNFKNSEFREIADKIEEVHKEAKRRKERKVRAVFVRIRPEAYLGETFVDIVSVDDAGKKFDFDANIASSVTCKIDGMPEDIANKVSVLRILNDGQHVPEIGMKISDTTYWVELEVA